MRIYHDIITMVLLISASALAIPVILKNPVYAQTDENFKVNIGLFGINITDNSDDRVITFVSINNVTKLQTINTAVLDAKDRLGLDGVVETIPFSFPNITVKAGEEFRACVFMFQTLDEVCNMGYNSPLNRTEHISLLLEEDKRGP